MKTKKKLNLCFFRNHRDNRKSGFFCWTILRLKLSVQSFSKEHSIPSSKVNTEKKKDGTSNVCKAKLKDQDDVPERSNSTNDPKNRQQRDTLKDSAVQTEGRRDDGHQGCHKDGSQVDQGS